MDTLSYILGNYYQDGHLPLSIPLTRNDLPTLFAELGYTEGAEIGVYKGEYSAILCKGVPGLKLHCIDAWKGYASHTQEDLDNALETAKQALAGYDVEFIRAFSMDAVHRFEDNSLDFVYIDGNHEWQHITQDLYHWARKVKPGGVVAGHDYFISDWSKSVVHVVPAVRGYTQAYKIRKWFVTSDKKMQSFFWVKE